MAVNYNCWCVKSTLIVSLVIALCLSIGKTQGDHEADDESRLDAPAIIIHRHI